MVGHGGILAFDERTDVRALARHLLEFGAARELRQVLPVPDRPAARPRDGRPARRGRPGAARGAARDARARLALRPRRRHARPDPQPDRALPRRARAERGELPTEEPDDPYLRRPEERSEDDPGTDEVEIDGRRSRSSPGPRSSTRRPRPAATCPRSASTSASRRSAPAASAWSASRAPPAPVAACTTPCRDGMVVRTDDATARRVAAATVELVLSELPEPPAPHTELARSRAFLEIGEPRWQGEQRTPAHDAPPPVPGSPARALHLVRALRPRLRRDPGRVRAHRHGPRLRLRDHRRARLGLHRFRLRVLRRLRRHLPHRRDHRGTSDRAGRGVH